MRPAGSKGKQANLEALEGPQQRQLAVLHGVRPLSKNWSLVRGNRGKVTVELGFYPHSLHLTTLTGINVRRSSREPIKITFVLYIQEKKLSRGKKPCIGKKNGIFSEEDVFLLLCNSNFNSVAGGYTL